MEKERNKRLLDWLHNKPCGPLIFIADLTRLCNLKCAYCFHSNPYRYSKFLNMKELPDEKWMEIVGQTISAGIREWDFVGSGEALVRKNLLMGMFEELKKHDVVMELTTIMISRLLRESSNSIGIL